MPASGALQPMAEPRRMGEDAPKLPLS